MGCYQFPSFAESGSIHKQKNNKRESRYIHVELQNDSRFGILFGTRTVQTKPLYRIEKLPLFGGKPQLSILAFCMEKFQCLRHVIMTKFWSFEGMEAERYGQSPVLETGWRFKDNGPY